MQTAISTALVVYGIAAVLALFVALMMKTIYWTMQLVARVKENRRR